MGFFASVNGEIVPLEEARVSVLDNGFLFGDSVYEVLRTYGGRPFESGRHFRRMRASADRLGIRRPLVGRGPSPAGDGPPRAGRADSNPTSESSSPGASATPPTTSTRCSGPTVVMIQKELQAPERTSLRRGDPRERGRRPPQSPPQPRPGDQVLKPAEQHPGTARGPRPGAREEPVLLNHDGFSRRGREHQRLRGEGRDPAHPAPLHGNPGRHHPGGRPRARRRPGDPGPGGAPRRRRPPRRGRGLSQQHHPRGDAHPPGRRAR